MSMPAPETIEREKDKKIRSVNGAANDFNALKVMLFLVARMKRGRITS